MTRVIIKCGGLPNTVPAATRVIGVNCQPQCSTLGAIYNVHKKLSGLWALFSSIRKGTAWSICVGISHYMRSSQSRHKTTQRRYLGIFCPFWATASVLTWGGGDVSGSASVHITQLECRFYALPKYGDCITIPFSSGLIQGHRYGWNKSLLIDGPYQKK